MKSSRNATLNNSCSQLAVTACKLESSVSGSTIPIFIFELYSFLVEQFKQKGKFTSLQTTPAILKFRMHRPHGGKHSLNACRWCCRSHHFDDKRECVNMESIRLLFPPVNWMNRWSNCIFKHVSTEWWRFCLQINYVDDNCAMLCQYDVHSNVELICCQRFLAQRCGA